MWAAALRHLDEVLGHFRRYTEKQLRDVAVSSGFHVEQMLKFNRAGVPAWWLNGRILQRKTFGIGQVQNLNLLTPLFRLMDGWLPLPPLSLIAILRKENGGSPASAGLVKDLTLRDDVPRAGLLARGDAADRGIRRFLEAHRYEAILLLLFVVTLPFINPWVRGDGVGYYAFAGRC